MCRSHLSVKTPSMDGKFKTSMPENTSHHLKVLNCTTRKHDGARCDLCGAVETRLYVLLARVWLLINVVVSVLYVHTHVFRFTLIIQWSRAARLASTKEKISTYRVLIEKLKERNSMENVRVDGRILFKCDVRLCIAFTWRKYLPVAGLLKSPVQ